MTERQAFASLALQLRRQWHLCRRGAAQALAKGDAADAQKCLARASRYLDDARWYLAKAMARPFIMEN